MQKSLGEKKVLGKTAIVLQLQKAFYTKSSAFKNFIN